MRYNDILEELCGDKYLWLVYNVSSAPVTPSHSTNPSEVTMVGGSGGRATRGSTSQQAAQSADNPAPPGPAHHGPADPEQDYSRLVLALMDALSEPDVVKKLNRDTINYDRISKEVSKQVQTLVQPLIDTIKQKDVEIAALNDKCDELQERCDDLEQYSRKNSIRISGIPETQDENPFKIVMEVCNKKLNLKSPLQLSEISNCHRVGQRKADGSHRQILVKFMNYQIRKRVFGAKSELKHHNKEFKKNQNVSPRNGDAESNVTSDSSDHNAESADRATDSVDTDADAPILMPGPIYINEDLCRGRAQLAHRASEIRRAGGINETWTFDGFVIVKDLQNKIKKISRRADLMKYERNWDVALFVQNKYILHLRLLQFVSPTMYQMTFSTCFF